MIVKIWVNCPSEKFADQIANKLLDERLVSSSNRYTATSSKYLWKGKIVTAREVPLLLKTRKELFGAVAEAIRRMHPYETPSILSIDVDQANGEYLEWMIESTREI
ncbi:divalent-cation tolerance protein CutA [Ruegeria atlantica]|uniref:divalent-cation tolerance protein CutA n=1 Tax=Ruegeria atlantica TaxID=81569 RepID=UPI001479E0D1|nr:divalent-cation tolerance protein CutA [Ruegeria atlantica]